MDTPTPQPAVAHLAMRRMSKAGLAKRTGYARGYVYRVLLGYMPATPEFRRRCAEALCMPEAELFHPATDEPARSQYPGDLGHVS